MKARIKGNFNLNLKKVLLIFSFLSAIIVSISCLEDCNMDNCDICDSGSSSYDMCRVGIDINVTNHSCSRSAGISGKFR